MPDRPDAPILFSAPMVRALLREIEAPGTGKTETRRVLKPQPLGGSQFVGIHFSCSEPDSWFFNSPHGPLKIPVRHKPDMLLWVRETWKPHSIYADRKPRDIPQTNVFYRADDAYAPSNTRWVPGIHMPRWGSRLTLLVRDVRVERLQAITDDGARAEGAPVDPCHRHTTLDGSGPPMVQYGPAQWRTVRAWFHLLWDHLHARDGYGWEANPWVTVTQFRVIGGNIGSGEVRRAVQQREGTDGN